MAVNNCSKHGDIQFEMQFVNEEKLFFNINNFLIIF